MKAYGDRELIGKVIEREVARTTKYAVLAVKIDLSVSTLYRARDGWSQTSPSTLSKIERGLELPYGTFALIGDRNPDGLRSLGVSEELIAWIKHEMNTTTTTAEPTRSAQKTSTPRTKRVTKRASTEV
jgi:hypothetical protein